jgi:hypothetical protein
LQKYPKELFEFLRDSSRLYLITEVEAKIYFRRHIVVKSAFKKIKNTKNDLLPDDPFEASLKLDHITTQDFRKKIVQDKLLADTTKSAYFYICLNVPWRGKKFGMIILASIMETAEAIFNGLLINTTYK